MHQYEFFFISLGLFCYFCILSVALGRDIKECLLVIVTVFNQFSLGNSNLPVIRLDTITTADFLDVITHTKPSAKNLSQKYTAWQREFESVWQEKTPKTENFQDFCYPKWHHLASKGSNSDGEGSAVVSRKENAVRRGKSSLSKFNGDGGSVWVFFY